MIDALPALDRPLGPLEFRVRRTGAADDAPFVAVGRRARVEGTGSGGVDTVWAGDVRVLRQLRVDGARPGEVLETPLGVERRLELAGPRIVERLVAHHDAPVVWMEWRVEPDGQGADGVPHTIDLAWRIGLDLPETAPGDRPTESPHWERHDRGLVVHRADPAARAVLVFGASPTDLTVDPDGHELRVRARFAIPGSGLRMAVVGVEPGQAPDRLLRIAGRTQVAVRAREGRANRLLGAGLRVTTPDPALDRALAAARLRLDAGGLPPSPGVWRTEDAVRSALAYLPAGDFRMVMDFLQRLARTAVGGRVPDRVLAGSAVSHDEGGAGLLFLLLTARYLAWSGDLAGVRGLWAEVESVLQALEPAGRPADDQRAAALGALAVAAEEIGASDAAVELRRISGGRGDEDRGRYALDGALIGHRDEPAIDPAAIGHRDEPALHAVAVDPAGVLLTHVGQLLAPHPDASRGRLELGPRPPEGWDRYEVRELAVGSAAVDVVYRRDGVRHCFEVEQTRGPAPLQVVLAPELPGRELVATRVDRKPAGLDVEEAGDRLRVPVQLVLDHLRTLEVEFADDTP